MIAAESLARGGVVFLLFLIFVVGLSVIFLRRNAAWALVGQLIAVKAVAAGAFLLSGLPLAGKGDLAMISLVALGAVPAAGFVGMVALHRCGRFNGTLDYDEEDSLRN